MICWNKPFEVSLDGGHNWELSRLFCILHDGDDAVFCVERSGFGCWVFKYYFTPEGKFLYSDGPGKFVDYKKVEIRNILYH